MLAERTIDIVKATAPILEEHGETLTQHFYKRMFAHNPEVAPLFNPAHQRAGSQQKALAAAICAYAAPRKAARPITSASHTTRSRKNMGVFWPCPSLDHPGTPRLWEDRKFKTPDGKAHIARRHAA